MFQILIPLSLLVRVWISRFYAHQRTTATSPPLLVRVWISRVETIEMGSTAFLPAHARVWIFSLLADPQRENGFLLAHVHVWIWLKRWRFHTIIYISQRTRNARIVYPSHSVNPNSTKCSSRTRAYGFRRQCMTGAMRSQCSSRTRAYGFSVNRLLFIP